MAAERSPRVSLVQAPVFTGDGPPNGLALLAAYLGKAEFEVTVHDVSSRIMAPLVARRGWNPEILRYYYSELSEALESDHEFREKALDEQAAAILSTEPDVVGFSIPAYTESCSLALASRVKRLSPRTIVICGGPQCHRETQAWDLVRDPSIDALALGEADRSLIAFLRALDLSKRTPPQVRGFLVKDRGRIVDCGDPEPVEDMDSLPFLDFTVFDMTRYRSKRFYLNASRGCVRRCAFCTHILEYKIYRTMTAARTVAEIEHQLRNHPNRCVVEFADSLVNGNVARLGEISDRLAKLRLERAAAREKFDLGWRGMAIIHETMSDPLLARLSRGGCLMLAYGLESGSQKVIDLMQKKFDVREARRCLRRTKKAGINVQLFLLVGFPGETDEDFQMTVDFIKEEAESIDGMRIATCQIAMGSHLDRHLDEYGVVMDPVHRSLWCSRDGSNTPAIRRWRYEELSRLAARLGFMDDERCARELLDSDSRVGPDKPRTPPFRRAAETL